MPDSREDCGQVQNSTVVTSDVPPETCSESPKVQMKGSILDGK